MTLSVRTGCGQSCARCPLEEQGDDSDTGLVRGGRLVAWSAAVFLVPLAGAIIGEVLAQRAGIAPGMGGVGGFVAAASLVWVVNKGKRPGTGLL